MLHTLFELCAIKVKECTNNSAMLKGILAKDVYEKYTAFAEKCNITTNTTLKSLYVVRVLRQTRKNNDITLGVQYIMEKTDIPWKHGRKPSKVRFTGPNDDVMSVTYLNSDPSTVRTIILNI